MVQQEEKKTRKLLQVEIAYALFPLFCMCGKGSKYLVQDLFQSS